MMHSDVLKPVGRFLTFLAMLLALLLVYRDAGRSTAAMAQNNAPVVVNSTKAFEVVEVTPSERMVTLKVKNTSTKTITAFSVSTPDMSEIHELISESGEAEIGPGQTTSLLFVKDSRRAEMKITIQSVVFDDNSSDGNSESVLRIRDDRMGRKLCLEQILPKLQKRIASSENISDAKLKELEAEIQILMPDNLPPQYRTGFKQAKREAVAILQRTAQGNNDGAVVDSREHLHEMKSKLENLRTRISPEK